MRSFLLSLFIVLISCAVGVFVFQNNSLIDIHIWKYSWSSSPGLLVLLSFGIGILLGMFWILPRYLLRWVTISHQRSQIQKLQQQYTESQDAFEALNAKIFIDEQGGIVLEGKSDS